MAGVKKRLRNAAAERGLHNYFARRTAYSYVRNVTPDFDHLDREWSLTLVLAS
jgi:hypothetical protein